MTDTVDIRVSRRAFGLTTGVWIVASTVINLQADEKADEDDKVVINLPPRERPQPGSVRLKTSGLIYSGMCSRQSSLAPDGIEYDQRLELRMIDQGARRLYVSNRVAEPAVVNPLDWPALTFEIKRKRVSRKPLPKGHRVIGPFDPTGRAQGEILLLNGEREEIQVAITKINELFAEVTSLTHDLTYSVAIDAIPRQHLVSGILQQVEDYDTQPFRRLELVRMLVKADRIPEAAILLQTLSRDFPDFADEQADNQQSVREALAQQITGELERRRSVGQQRLASNGARLHPRENLTPETVVRVTQLVNEADDRAARIARARQQLPGLVAEVTDAAQRQLATELVNLIDAQLDEDSIDRLSAFELIAEANANPNGVAGNVQNAAELLALAGSGWLMGAESSCRSLPETLALFEVQQLLTDYLATDAAEVDARRLLIERMLPLEGVSIERLAALARTMPSPRPIMLEAPAEGQPMRFRIASSPEMAGAVGVVPPEYHQSRNYPTIIAFSGNYADPESYVAWWQAEAVRNGCIVVIPIWHVETDAGVEQTSAELPEESKSLTARYDASANQHLQFLNLMRQLKLGLRIDDSRVFVAGHGTGGEAALDMAASHPDLFAGAGSICGVGRRHLQWTFWNAVSVPMYVVVGDKQPAWFEQMGTLAAKMFRRSDETKQIPDVVFVKYPNRGIESYGEETDDFFRWIASRSRVAYPERIAADLLRSTDLDWYWLRLQSLPAQFAQLDEPSRDADESFKPAALKVRLNDKNAIIVEASPGNLTVFLSPEIPGYDIQRPLLIANGRKRVNVTYQPQTSHLLERLYETGDRQRLCFMRVEVED